MTKEELAQLTHNELGKIESIITDKKTHKDCINKEKLIEYINNLIKLEPERRTDVTLFILKTLIETGEFDND